MFFNGMGGIGGGAGGGAGGAGGNMMRAVGRAVTRAGVAGLQDPISTTPSTAASSNSASPASRKTRRGSSTSSGSGSSLKAEFPTNFGWTSPFGSGSYYASGGPFDEYSREWEWVDGGDGDSTSSDDKEVVIYGLTDDFGFGSAPSADEVHSAVNQLSQFVGSGRFSRLIRDKYGDEENSYPTGFELDWKEPSSPQFSTTASTRALQPYGSDTVHRAFHLLQSDQSVQRMVTSLSSDAAIWDAVMNNEVVRELRQAYYPDGRSEDSTTPKSTVNDEADDVDETSDLNIVQWIIDNTKARVTELMENIAKLLNLVFAPRAGDESGERAGIAFDEKVTTSLFLSVVVLLIVVLGRSQKA